MFMRIKRLLGPRFLIGIACLLVFLGVAEGYVRYKGYIPAPDYEKLTMAGDVGFDPDLGWAAAENDRMPIGEPDPFQLFTKVWKDGQRESRPLVMKRAKKRVLVLGCSYTFGIGVRSQDTFTWLLNQRFPDIDFDNHAFQGYGTLQCLINEEIQLQRRPYDLVLYAPFNDHLNRNIFAINCIRDIERSSEPLTDVLKQNHIVWFQPTAQIDRYHQLVEHRPYYEHWPFDTVSALSNTLKRIHIFNSYVRSLNRKDSPGEIQIWREVYWRILYRMHEAAQKHVSKFAVICLEDEKDPANLLYLPNDKELAIMNSAKEPLSFPPPFTYKYVSNGRNGAPDGPQFHVGGLESGHPIPAMHKIWAAKIAEMIPELIMNS